jgi:hypothetical protein
MSPRWKPDADLSKMLKCLVDIQMKRFGLSVCGLKAEFELKPVEKQNRQQK